MAKDKAKCLTDILMAQKQTIRGGHKIVSYAYTTPFLEVLVSPFVAKGREIKSNYTKELEQQNIL